MRIHWIQIHKQLKQADSRTVPSVNAIVNCVSISRLLKRRLYHNMSQMHTRSLSHDRYIYDVCMYVSIAPILHTPFSQLLSGAHTDTHAHIPHLALRYQQDGDAMSDRREERQTEEERERGECS